MKDNNMDKQGKISVILPVYNVYKYIERCINSLINQTYENIEICIVDDGSSDGSEVICDNYSLEDNRIKVYHQQNSGPSIARNKGLEMATGDYIFFMDSDDYLNLNTFSFLLKELEDKSADISCCAARIVNEKGEEKPYLEEKEYILNTEEALEHCMFRNTIGTVVWAKLYKRSVFQDVIFPEYKNAEDEYVVYRLVANSNKVVYTGKYLYSLFVHSDSLGGTGKNTVCMWYFEAWCQREQFLREKGYKRLADMTMEKIIQVLYEKRNDISNVEALNNCLNATEYVKKHLREGSSISLIERIKYTIKILIIKNKLTKY